MRESIRQLRRFFAGRGEMQDIWPIMPVRKGCLKPCPYFGGVALTSQFRWVEAGYDARPAQIGCVHASRAGVASVHGLRHATDPNGPAHELGRPSTADPSQ
jgi:hypothetical protein